MRERNVNLKDKLKTKFKSNNNSNNSTAYTNQQ